MSGLGMSILLEGEAIGEARGEARGEAIGEARGEDKGIDLCVEIIQALKEGETDNAAIAKQCGCTPEKVAKIRQKLGI